MQEDMLVWELGGYYKVCGDMGVSGDFFWRCVDGSTRCVVMMAL